MLVNKNSLLRSALFLLLALYFAQGPLYPTGHIIGKVSLLGVLLISTYFFLKSLVLKNTKPVFYYAVLLLLVINFIGFVAGGNYAGTHFSQIRNILTALLPFFAFYYLAERGDLNEKHLLVFSILMLPVAILSFHHSKSTILLERAISSENVVNNTAYLFVSLIPFVFFWGRRQLLGTSNLLILVFFIIQGSKRGAIIAAALGVLVFAYYQFANTELNKRIQGYAVALIGVLALTAFALHFFESNEFLIRRMQEVSDGGSGRDRIYTTLLMAWYDGDSILNYLFGFGFVATLDKSGSGHLAHNDWLELLTNFGLFGVMVYFLIFASVGRYVVNKNIPQNYRLIMFAVGSMWFLQTLFSMYYTASGTAITMIVLGYLIGTQKIRPSNKRIKPRIDE